MGTKTKMITGILILSISSPSLCKDDYVDFSNMASYDHGNQINRLNHETDPKTTDVVNPAIVPLRGISVENGSRPMKFLQRVVKSLLRQMSVQSHVFGPGEAITIDLQAEIKYNDYVVLNKFVNSAESDEPDKYLTKIDDIMSNLLHVVEHSGSRLDYFEFLFNLPLFNSLKFWLVLVTMSVVIFMIIMLSLRTVYASSNAAMLLYGFLIIYILSCIWTFSYMYEEARSSNYAKLMQTQSPPKDCEYENLGFRDSVSYFFRVHLLGYKDRCEQYYSTTMTDPFWSVNPLEAISKSFTVLVFAPLGYVGDKVGLFFGGIIRGIPFWLQPLMILLMFGFLFLSLFGYRIVSPLFTIEPARRQYLDQGTSGTVNPAITGQVKNELMERPERKIMKSVRDAATDMDDFENYINGYTTDERMRSRSHHWIILYIIQVGTIIWEIIDQALRQCPEEVDSEVEEDFPNEEYPLVPDIVPDEPAGNEEVILPHRGRRRSLEEVHDENSEVQQGDVPNDLIHEREPENIVQDHAEQLGNNVPHKIHEGEGDEGIQVVNNIPAP